LFALVEGREIGYGGWVAEYHIFWTIYPFLAGWSVVFILFFFFVVVLFFLFVIIVLLLLLFSVFFFSLDSY